MGNYNHQILSLENPSFKQIREIAKNNCGRICPGLKICKPWNTLGHGVDLLDSHENLCKYLCSYGEMHEEKMEHALKPIKKKESQAFKRELTIIDWGCGQGLATICFFDYLKKEGYQNQTKKVILIEPSEMALNRAKLHVNAYLKDENKLKPVKEYLDDVSKEDIRTDTPVIFHFFSNILDIPTIDLKKLAQNVGDETTKEQYCFCITPLDNGNRRVEAFYNYFKKPQKLEEEHESSLERTKRTLKLIVFKLEAGKVNLIKIDYYPPVQFHAAYQVDFVAKTVGKLSEEEKKKYDLNSSFEVATPFDIGASIYNDVHPIYAVLNNIVTRGLPTRPSPFIEEVFQVFGNQRLHDDLGNILFGSDKYLPDDIFTSIEYLAPIAVARMQKTILEALMTNKISIENKEWHILVIERDVPCAAIAFEDLKQMFEHLTALSKEYSPMSFPFVKLEIISTGEFVDSSLHLDIKPSTTISDQQRLKEYDMVIDVSVKEQSDISKVTFSEFKSNNNCYFNIRSAKRKRIERYIYTSDAIDYRPLVTKDAQGNYHEISDTKEHLQYFLQLLFRKEDFRPGQLPILDRALQNKSVIGLLPTGGGKSLTYQLAGMLQPGVTLVIDPLRSLMKDQYDGLINAGIDTCTYINSTLTPVEKTEILKLMQSSQMQFIFLSPERLCIYEFRESLKVMHDMHVYFAYGVIDEVHCVSEWGHDFRFSYLHLGRNLYNYVLPKDQDKRLTLFGLTATASFDVLADVERELSGNGAFPLDADTIIRYENTNRLELQYKIERVPVQYQPDINFDKKNQLKGVLQAVNISDKWAVYQSKKEYLKYYINEIPDLINELQTENVINTIKSSFQERQNSNDDLNEIDLSSKMSKEIFQNQNEYKQAGIVFCPHKNNTGISVFENETSLKRIVPVLGTFVGSSDGDEDNNTDTISFSNLDKFRDNKLPLMVATKAFGMGIDKPNVRFTINLNYSSSLESFVQEAGRAGRDRKIALASILFADYKLVRINKKCSITEFPISIVKDKWFKEEELKKFLQNNNISIDSQYFDFFTPQKDLVKLSCEICNTRFAFRQCEYECNKYTNCTSKSKGKDCKVKCDIYNCVLREIPQEARGFQYVKDLEEIFKNLKIEIPKTNLEYISADYRTVMYFYNNNFKGSLIEKEKMHNILSKSKTEIFFDDEEEIKPTETVNNFLEKFISTKVGTEIVAFVKYTKEEKNDIEKAIYRMCCIGLIDDFTQDFNKKRFRIVTKRKEDGEYYQGLKRFLMRYYSADKAEEEIKKVTEREGENEVHKCLEYLTEFIYEKIAVKRKRAIDDMRTFCIQGLDETKNWKEVNEDLKDFIYYYFNSKYAKDDYKADNDEPFSLTEDTDRGKLSHPDIVLKFIRVVDDDIVGAGGTPKDNVKHLQGAVRLIRRSLTDKNPALDLLNAFCLFYLGTNNNVTLEEELIRSYKDGLIGFFDNTSNHKEFWYFFENYHDNIIRKANEFKIERLNEIKEEITANIHAKIIKSLTNKYTAL